MATVIYDDTFGARSTKVFGCSFKSITAQMGFNSQPIVFTVTVVEEEDQDFTLDQYDVRSAQYISFGELSILGIVQGWEGPSVDPNGTGVYAVRLTDCRTVLDSANIANVYVDEPESNVALINSNIVYVGTTGNASENVGSNREENTGVLFSTIMERVEAATLHYGDDVFEVDMSELATLTNWRGEGVNQYYIEGEVRSLVSTITEFCNAVGAEWWVESRRKSVIDNTVVIQIKVIRRLDGIGNPLALEMDNLVALHDGHVIRRKDGYENQDIITHKVIWGGVKRKLNQVSDVEIKQFWGFDSDGQPLTTPSYTMPDEPQSRRIQTSVAEMENVLNGDLDDIMDADQLSSLKRYIDDFWGKRFYYTLNKNTLSDSGNDLPNYPEIIPAGWWEGTTPPHGVRQFDPDILLKMTTEDGRWGPFVRLSELFLTGSGTVEYPLIPHYITWAPIIQNSNNLITRESESYMKCTLEQYGRYVIMVLPTALTRYFVNTETNEIDSDRVTRHSALSSAWIPLMDRGIHYGPWSNTSLARSRVPSPGASEVCVDRDLVPWTFGVRGLSHTIAMSQLTDMAEQKIDTLPGLSIINTGQLEVADVPKVNIGQAVGLGGSITEIFIRFDTNGVLTRYVMNLYTRELGEFKRRKQREREEQQEEDEKQLEDKFPDNKDDFEEPPEPEPAPEAEEAPTGPTPEVMDYVYQKPEGGLGVISVKEGGPFYSVRRLSYADIDPDTFAGGLDITGSYFLAEWNNVRNLAEAENSPGLLPVGTRVTVSIFSEYDEHGPYVAYIEQTPQVFTPPVVDEDGG
jgi:hypothetical protein